MRKTDMILPHRQMIHGSLRKEAEKLSTRKMLKSWKKQRINLILSMNR